MSVTTWARRAAGNRRGEGWPRRPCTKPRRPPRRKRALRRLNCRTVRRNARAPSWFVILPARAALTSPARGTSFLLIVKVSMRDDISTEQLGGDIFIEHQKDCQEPLTTLLGQANLGAPFRPFTGLAVGARDEVS